MSDQRQHPVRLSLAAGFSSAFFCLLWDALKNFIALTPHEKAHELIVIFATSLGMLVFIEPILERIGPVRLHESSRREDSIVIRVGAFLTIVATSLFHGLLHAHINESISVHGMIVVEQWASSLLAPCVITFSWLYAARQERSQARWYGFIAGLIVGFAGIGLTLVELYFFYPSLGFGATSAHRTAMAMLFVETAIPWFVVPVWGISGYLGGLAIDRHWCSRAWRGAALGLMIAAAVGAALAFVMSVLISVEIRGVKTAVSEPRLYWLSLTLFVETAIVNLGWALGLFIAPESDLLLGREGALPQPIPHVTD